MLRNFLLVGWRNLIRSRFYTLINIFGLALGIAGFLLVIIYLKDETSFDTFHTKADRIYRINEFIASEGSSERSASLPFPTGPTLKDEYPNYVSEFVRFFDFQSPTLSLANLENRKEFNEPNIFFVDSTFFKVFDYKVIKGNLATALSKPRSIMLTEKMARKYFGEEDPMGKTLRIRGQQDLEITGILAEPPSNTHFHFDFLVSFSTLLEAYGGQLPKSWYWNPCWTYVLLHDKVQPEDLEKQFPQFVRKYFPEFIRDETNIKLQPVSEIHLTSRLDYEIEPNGNESNVYLFGAIAIFIILIAAVNYMNLATARSMKRSREVGMRKTLGGMRYHLVIQFLIESVVTTLIAVVISTFLVFLALPQFNILAGKSVSLQDLIGQPWWLWTNLALVLIIGVGSGIYPSLILSSFKPVAIFKGQPIKRNRVSLRKILVVFQFTISMILIILTFIAVDQLKFMREDDPGFERKSVILLPVTLSSIARNYEPLVNEIKQSPGVVDVTALEEILGAKHQTLNFQFEGMDESRLFPRLFVRHDFFKTFDIDIISGRAFSRDYPTDDSLALVVNTALVKQMGWTPAEAVGKKFNVLRFQGEIVGVTEDFNFASKHEAIQPLVLQLNTQPFAFNLFMKYLAIRLDMNNLNETLAYIHTTWDKYIPERPFDYFFLDQELYKLYKSEDTLSKVAGIFSGFAIFIACLGLFGLSSFMAEQRRKEIGIRKVLGGSVRDIVFLLSSDFTLLIVIAFLFAAPLGYYISHLWLQQFAFRIDMGIYVFVAAGVSSLVIALITISYHAIKAANLNPARIIRTE